MNCRFAVPTPTAMETEDKTEAAATKSPLIDSPCERNLTEESSGLSAARGAEEAKPHSSSTRQTHIAADNLLSTSEEESFNRAREQQRKLHSSRRPWSEKGVHGNRSSIFSNYNGNAALQKWRRLGWMSWKKNGRVVKKSEATC